MVLLLLQPLLCSQDWKNTVTAHCSTGQVDNIVCWDMTQCILLVVHKHFCPEPAASMFGTNALLLLSGGSGSPWNASYYQTTKCQTPEDSNLKIQWVPGEPHILNITQVCYYLLLWFNKLCFVFMSRQRTVSHWQFFTTSWPVFSLLHCHALTVWDKPSSYTVVLCAPSSGVKQLEYKRTTHLYQMLRSRISGVIPPYHHAFLQHGA